MIIITFCVKYRKEMRELNKQVGKTVKHDDLSEETKKILHETFENFYEKESVAMIDMIEDSRKEVADSVLELMDEQKRLKDELNRLSNIILRHVYEKKCVAILFSSSRRVLPERLQKYDKLNSSYKILIWRKAVQNGRIGCCRKISGKV